MIWLALVIAFSVWCYARSDLYHAFTARIPSDFEVYLLGGQKVADHLPLYDGDLMPGLPFTYPPFAGVVFSWLGEATSAKGIAWSILSVVVLACVVHGSSISKSPWLRTLLLTAFFVVCTEPVHATLYFGQINILLMGLVCLDFLPKSRLPGIGTGLAAGLKLTPAFFLLLLVVQRRWGSVAIAAFTFLCTVAVGMEVQDAGDFWSRAMFDSSRVGTEDNPGALALKQVLHRAGTDLTVLWLVLVVLIVALCAVASWRAPAPLAVGFVGMTACIVSPFSWFHHWVWIVPFGVWVYQRYGVAAMLVAMAPYFAVNVTGMLEGTWHDLLFVGVPVVFMVLYAFVHVGSTMRSGLLLSKKGTHAYPTHRSHSGRRNRTHSRPSSIG